LFIFAFTAVRYLSEERITTDKLQKRFLAIVESSRVGSNRGTQPIDDLYQEIFISACDKKESDEAQETLEFVHSIILLQKPLSVRAISQLFADNIDDVRTHLQHFYAVIDTPKSDDDLVLVFHASFPDYIHNEKRSRQYSANICLQHTKLALRSFKWMNDNESGVRENICGIATRQTRNPNVSDASIQRNIPSSLQYACMFWASHLREGGGDDTLGILNELNQFVRKHILHWLECLSLINELGISVGCLRQALALLPVCMRFII
jgi:hypothetical protein